MTKALTFELLHLLQHRLRRWSASVGVAIDGKPALSSQQLVYRYTQQLAFDIPQGLIQAAQRVIQHRSVAPVRTYIGGLPDIFDVVHVFAAAKIIQVFVDGRNHSMGALAESGAAHTIQTRLVGLGFYYDQLNAIGSGGDRRYFADFYYG